MFFWRRRHPISAEDLSAYIDGQLPADAGARIEAHVEECSACREALGELRAVRQVLREMPRVEAPRSFALREADIRPVAPPRPAGALGRAPALLSGVAMTAFLAFGVLVGVDVVTQTSGGDADYAARGTTSGLMDANEQDSANIAPAAAIEGQEGPEGMDGEDPSADGEPELAMDVEAGAGEERDDGLSAAPLAPQPTPECPPNVDCKAYLASLASPSPSPLPTPSPSPATTPMARAAAEVEDDDHGRLRAAEAATAAVALVAGASLALVWWRRRA